jgi:hypothetical protein
MEVLSPLANKRTVDQPSSMVILPRACQGLCARSPIVLTEHAWSIEVRYSAAAVRETSTAGRYICHWTSRMHTTEDLGRQTHAAIVGDCSSTKCLTYVVVYSNMEGSVLNLGDEPDVSERKITGARTEIPFPSTTAVLKKAEALGESDHRMPLGPYPRFLLRAQRLIRR